MKASWKLLKSSARSAMFIASARLWRQAPLGAACPDRTIASLHMPLLKELENISVMFGFYKHGAPQQPAKGVLLVGASPTRRIRRFTTERPGACPTARLEGIEQSWHRTDGPK